MWFFKKQNRIPSTRMRIILFRNENDTCFCLFLKGTIESFFKFQDIQATLQLGTEVIPVEIRVGIKIFQILSLELFLGQLKTQI